ncbi:hypothetical protein [Pelagibacterium sediminicola]|uniref:hypothetical protein n=1 Tax=Pelagibacterium sediminicola TaxID=2248761 RepID=UPI000E320B88|nr:hypothetical protein [Pelagibacterium sediminicola]
MSKLARQDILNVKSIIIGVACVLLAVAFFTVMLPALGLVLPGAVAGALAGSGGVLMWFAILRRGRA